MMERSCYERQDGLGEIGVYKGRGRRTSAVEHTGQDIRGGEMGYLYLSRWAFEARQMRTTESLVPRRRQKIIEA